MLLRKFLTKKEPVRKPFFKAVPEGRKINEITPNVFNDGRFKIPAPVKRGIDYDKLKEIEEELHGKKVFVDTKSIIEGVKAITVKDVDDYEWLQEKNRIIVDLRSKGKSNAEIDLYLKDNPPLGRAQKFKYLDNYVSMIKKIYDDLQVAAPVIDTEEKSKAVAGFIKAAPVLNKEVEKKGIEVIKLELAKADTIRQTMDLIQKTGLTYEDRKSLNLPRYITYYDYQDEKIAGKISIYLNNVYNHKFRKDDNQNFIYVDEFENINFNGVSSFLKHYNKENIKSFEEAGYHPINSIELLAKKMDIFDLDELKITQLQEIKTTETVFQDIENKLKETVYLLTGGKYITKEDVKNEMENLGFKFEANKPDEMGEAIREIRKYEGDDKNIPTDEDSEALMAKYEAALNDLNKKDDYADIAQEPLSGFEFPEAPGGVPTDQKQEGQGRKQRGSGFMPNRKTYIRKPW